MTDKAERYLLELTNLPTASGREDRVIAWVSDWARRYRRQVQLRRDRFGNVLLKRKGARSRRPIVFAAHMDHPAFVVTAVDGRQVEAVFRGGVQQRYFKNAAVVVHHGDEPSPPGRIVRYQADADRKKSNGRFDFERHVIATFEEPVEAEPGDVMTWALPSARIDRGRLRAPACDDLAGVAATIAAFEALLRPRRGDEGETDVRVLLTRAEEIGFVGALAACRSRIVPKGSRLIALENSKSYAESPIGGGPIVRVGDRTSTFDPDLTYRLAQIAASIADSDPGFNWQRKLMPGGTCEASAYLAMGYQATCLCLPLGHYHNMNEQAGRIDSEIISIADYHGLIDFLVEIGRTLDEPGEVPPLRARLDELFERRKVLLS